MPGTTFDNQSAERIARVVRQAEGGQLAGQGRAAQADDVVWVLTTSGTATGGLYPGVMTLYSARDAAWNTYSPCKVLSANGDALADATRYPCKSAGRDAAGDEVFVTTPGSGGGGGGGAFGEHSDGGSSTAVILSVDSTWYTVATIGMTSAGTYLITAEVFGEIATSAGGGYIEYDLYNNSAFAPIIGSRMGANTLTTAWVRQNTVVMAHFTTTGGGSVSLRARRVPGGGGAIAFANVGNFGGLTTTPMRTAQIG